MSKSISLFVLVGLGTASMLSSGCCKHKADEEKQASPSSSAVSASPSAAAATPGQPGTQGNQAGPVVKIPAGTLVAGTPCPQAPRVTNEELAGVRIQMGDFDMDMYPYPNDPNVPPKTQVSRQQAEQLCQARGRRLCTELEWERACKGPTNSMYPYGNKYQKLSACRGKGAVLMPSKSYEGCQSGFGVKSMFGAVWEWTSSSWGRGTSGGMSTVRGGPARNNYVQSRCANGQGRAPAGTFDDVGFRCCGGPVNPATVSLPVDRRSALIADPSVDPGLARTLMRSLPSSMRHVGGFKVQFDRVWRWHPRANEEMIVGRYRASRIVGTGEFFHPVVFHRCTKGTWRVAKLRGPVETMAAPSVGSNRRQVSIHVKTGSDEGDVRFRYHYGFVSVNQPSWIKTGSSLDTGSNAPAVGKKLKFRIPMFKKK